jgi:hypothetical protein
VTRARIGKKSEQEGIAVNVPCLPVGHYRLTFHPRETLRFQAHAGSAWRGAFGRALKRTVCVTRAPRCEGCLLFHSCPYPYLFETPPPQGAAKMRRYSAVPHPFVIAPLAAGVSAPGQDYALGLALFGRANQYLPYVVHALSQAAHEGIGSARTALDLAEVRQQESTGGWARIYSCEGTLCARPPFVPEPPPLPLAVAIKIETPLRLKRENDNITSETFRFVDLFSSLLRRISMLTYFHTDTPLETDFAGITAAARAVPIAGHDLRWEDWTRYSSRQETLMQLGGLVGTLRLEGSDLAPFWPYLWLGQWTHAGKATSMGLGAYRIEAASLPKHTVASP